MLEKKVELTGEMAAWLQKLRLQSRMSIAEAAREAQVEEASLIGWESAFPIPLPDFLVLMTVYRVGSLLVGAKITQVQTKYLEGPFTHK